MKLLHAGLIFVVGVAFGAAAIRYGDEWQSDRELDVLEAEVQALAVTPFDAERYVAAGRRMHELGHDGGSARLGAMDETLLIHAEGELIAALDSGAPCWGVEQVARIHTSLKLAFTGEHSAGADLLWQRFARTRDERILKDQDLARSEGMAAEKQVRACMARVTQSP